MNCRSVNSCTYVLESPIVPNIIVIPAPNAQVNNPTAKLGVELPAVEIDLLDSLSDKELAYNLANCIDDIEKITVQIFFQLNSIADQKNQSEAITSDIKEGLEEPKVKIRVHHIHQDSNLEDANILRKSTNTGKFVSNFFRSMKTILIGEKLIHSNQNLTKKVKGPTFDDNRIVWKKAISKFYKRSFKDLMKKAFQHADSLIQERKSYLKISYYLRITFYALLIITAFGKLANRKYLFFAAMTSTTICLIAMITRYGISFFKQSKLVSTLKTTLEIAEREGGKSRLPLSST